MLADFVQGSERFKKAAAEVKDIVLGAQMCMLCVSTTIMKHTSYGSRGNCRVAKAQDPTNREQGQIYMASGTLSFGALLFSLLLA
jgi:hypothetical protein